MKRLLSLTLAGAYVGMVLGLIVGGCHMAATSNTATVQKTDDIGHGVGTESKAIAGNATGIKTEVKAAGDATPANAKPQVQPHLDAATAKADAILVSTARLDDLAGQIGQLKASIEAEQTAHARETADLRAEIVRNNSDFQHKLNLLSLAAIGLFGVAVALAFLLHDFTYAVAGGAACGAVVLASILTGVAAKFAMWIAAGVAVALAAWVGVTWYRKGSLSAALRTDWAQAKPVAADQLAKITDIIRSLGTNITVTTPPAAAPPAAAQDPTKAGNP